MGRRSAAGAGAAAAQVEASSAAGPKDPPGKHGEGHRRKRSMIFVKKTIVKPQSPKKDSDKQPKQKLAPSPPPMPARARQGKRKSSPRGVAPSPPRIRDGKVVSPSPMSRPRVNGHYTPPKYTSPPPGYGPGGRHPSPPPPVGIRGRPARCLSPTPSISPPPEPRGRKTRRTSYSPSPDRVNRGPRSPPRMSPTRGPRFSRGQREGRDRSPGSQSPSPSRQSTVICGMQPPFPTRPTHSPSMDDLRYGSRGGMYDDSPPMAERALEEIYASSPRIPSSPTMRGGYLGGRGGVYASPPRLPPSPPMRGRMPSRGGIYGSDTRVPSTPQVRGRAGARGGVYASPPRLPQFPSERSRSRTGQRPPSPPASRMAPTSVPRSRRASPSPPARMIPPSPDMTMRASRSQQRRPQPPTTFPHIPPLPLTQHTGRSRGEISLSRHDSAIRGLSPVRIDPIPSPIYERLSPVPQSGKRGRSPSPPTPVPIPGYLASKPPLPPQALSSRRPQSPSQRRSLGPSSNKRSPSPDLKRRYSCVTVIPRDANFSPHLPRPPPTAPSNFKRIAPNFAARRSRKASFVILNEKEVKRKSDSRRGSVDEGELDHEGEGEEGDGQEGDEGETGEGRKKSSKGKGGKTKAVSIVLVEDEDEPESARSKGKLSARKTKEGGLSPRPPSGGRSSPGVAGTPTPRGDKSPSPRPSPTPRDPSGQEPLLGATLGAPVNETLEAATASGSESHRESSRAPSASLVPPAGSAASRAGTPTPGGDPAAVSRAATPVPGSDAAGGVPSRAPSATGIRDQKQILEAGSLGATSPVPTEVSGGKPAATPTDKPVSIQGVTGGEGEGYTPRSGGGSILEGSVATQGGEDGRKTEDGSGDGGHPVAGGQEKRGSVAMERIEEEHGRAEVERMEIGETGGDAGKGTGEKKVERKLERQKTVESANKKGSPKAEKGPGGGISRDRPRDTKGSRNAGRSQEVPGYMRSTGGMRSSGSVKSLGKDDDQISQKSLRSSKSTSSVRSLGKAEDRRSLGSTGSVSGVGRTEQKSVIKGSDSVKSLGKMDDQPSARSSRSGSVRSLGKMDEPVAGRSRGSVGSVKSLGKLEDQVKGKSSGSLRSSSSVRSMGSVDEQLSVKSSGSTRGTGARQRSSSLRTSGKPQSQVSIRSSESVSSLVKGDDEKKGGKGKVLTKSSSTAGGKQPPKTEGSVRRTQSIQSISKEDDDKTKPRVLGKQKSSEKDKKTESSDDNSQEKKEEEIKISDGAKSLEIVDDQGGKKRTEGDNKPRSRPGSAKNLQVPKDDTGLKKTGSLDISDGEKTPSRPSSGKGLGKPIDRARKESIKSSMLKFMINMDNEDEMPDLEKKDSLEKPDLQDRKVSTQRSESDGNEKDSSRPGSSLSTGQAEEQSKRRESLTTTLENDAVRSRPGSAKSITKSDEDDKPDGEKQSRPSSGRALGKPIDRARKESIKSSMLKFMINMDNEDGLPPPEKSGSLEKPDEKERRESIQSSDSGDGKRISSRPGSARSVGKEGSDRRESPTLKSDVNDKAGSRPGSSLSVGKADDSGKLTKTENNKSLDKLETQKSLSRPGSGGLDKTRKQSIKSSMLKFMINMDNEDDVPTIEKSSSLEKPDEDERRGSIRSSGSIEGKDSSSRPGSSLSTGKAKEGRRESLTPNSTDNNLPLSRPGSAQSLGKPEEGGALKKTESNKSLDKTDEHKSQSRPSSGRNLGKPIDNNRRASIKSQMLKFMINMDNEDEIPSDDKGGSLEKPDDNERRASIQSTGSTGSHKQNASRPGSGRSTGKVENQESQSRPSSGRNLGKPIDNDRRASIKSQMLKFMINMDNEDEIPSDDKGGSLEKPDDNERRASIQSTGSTGSHKQNASRPGSGRSTGKVENQESQKRRESTISTKETEYQQSVTRPASAQSSGGSKDQTRRESGQSSDGAEGQLSVSRPGSARRKTADQARKESIKSSMLKFMLNMDNEEGGPAPESSSASTESRVDDSGEKSSQIDKTAEGDGGKNIHVTQLDAPASKVGKGEEDIKSGDNLDTKIQEEEKASENKDNREGPTPMEKNEDQGKSSEKKAEEKTGSESDGDPKVLVGTVDVNEAGNLAAAEGEGGSEVGQGGNVEKGKNEAVEPGDCGLVPTIQEAKDAEIKDTGLGNAERGGGQTNRDDLPGHSENREAPTIEIQTSTPVESSAENSVAGDPPSTPTTPRVE